MTPLRPRPTRAPRPSRATHGWTGWTLVDSPIEELLVVAHGSAPDSPDAAVGQIQFSPYVAAATSDRADDAPVLALARTQLREYFAGDRKDFDLPLDPLGTPFQHRVWEQLSLIGYGETATYGEIAHRLGMTNAASRAVGLANGRNPIPVVVPCHRVIGADGRLTGYAGGLPRKERLLVLEGHAPF